jgi:soluble lytic murein transglycosylase-like protein
MHILLEKSSKIELACRICFLVILLSLAQSIKGQTAITDADIPPPEPVKSAEQSQSKKSPERQLIKNNNSELDRAIEMEAKRYNIDPLLIYALIKQESGGKAHARSHKGAMGVMQLMPATARRFKVQNPYSVKEAVRGGVEYLVWLMDRYKGDVVKALAGYNAGEGAVDKYKGVPPYRETRNYVRSIASHYRRLKSADGVVGDSKPKKSNKVVKEKR